MTRFLINLHATPADWQRDLFYSVVRAGHLVAGPEHRIQRETYPGHEWILCLRGRGWVRIEGRRHEVSPGSLAWVNCHHPHDYGAIAADPWELYWLRLEGPSLDRLGRFLSIGSQPVIAAIDMPAASVAFTTVFSLMEETATPAIAAKLNEVVAGLIAIAVEARMSSPSALEPEHPPALRRALERLRLYYHLPTRVADLAKLAGMSESHFSRMFKAALGTSPIDWLRRERINQAKRRLIESDDTIKEVAMQVGYSDQFFFSKDFKRMTKLTPTEFRLREKTGSV